VRFLKPLTVVLVALVGAFLLASAFPVKVPPVEVVAEPIAHLPFLGAITNAQVTTWLVMILLVWLAAAAMRSRSLVPSGLQNMMEAMVEALWNLSEDVAGEKRVRKFFPIMATIFFFVLLSNWLGLLPGVGTLGLWETVNGERVIVPLLRSPSTDLNTTLALALISVILTQIFGIQALGVLRYFGKFINLTGTAKLLGALTGRSPKPARPTGYIMLIFFAAIDLFMGVLEFVSEVAKILSFSFRLFGNIFAGEVLLVVIAFLMPYLLPLPFLGLEVFVGFIQAFVFAVLTLVFMTIATTGHGGEEHPAAENLSH
jgi:F-type H+-transporting ATPase subunit a